MKVLLIGPNYFNYVTSIKAALEKMDVIVNVQTYGNLYDDCSYLQKKMDSLGVIDLKKIRTNNWNQHILQVVSDFQPDICMICNGTIMTAEILKVIKNRGIKLILWLLDGLKRNVELKQNLSFYDRCFVYDVLDVEYITQKYSIPSTHLVSSYDRRIYYPDNSVRDIDISFVGKTTPKRLNLLKQVANYAFSHNRTFITYGNYWGERYFWKKMQFKSRHSPLELYAVNAKLDPELVAQLYRRTKICLNIHIAEHDGLNPRTFEILGTNSFALVDDKAELAQYFQIGKHLAVYRDTDDLLEKIDYYLQNDEARETIATEGYAHVANTHEIDSTVRRVWSLIIQ